MARRDVNNAKTSLAGYFVCYTEYSEAGPNYYAFINNRAGSRKRWYIQRETISGSVSTFEYFTEREDVQTLADAWTGRAGLTYVRYDVAFPE